MRAPFLLYLLYLAVLVLGIFGLWEAVLAQPGGGGGVVPPCSYGCRDILWMGGYQNGIKYCWSFEFPTGRIVWSHSAPIGGNPVQDTGCRQVVWKYNACPGGCDDPAQTPQTVTLGGFQVGSLGFGCYSCSGS